MKQFLITVIALLALFTPSGLAQSRIQIGNITAAATSCTSISGESSNGACVAMQIPVNDATATIQLQGSFSGTVQFEVSSDGVNFYAADGVGTTNATSATDVGLWQFQVAALSWIRARASSFVSGPVAVRITSSLAPSPVGPLVLNDPSTANQGTPGATAWPVLPQDSGGGDVTDSVNHAVLTESPNGNPCQTSAPTFVAINQAAAGPLVIVSGTALTKIYVCSLGLGAAGTVNATLIQGHGSNCGTGTAGMIGGATAATGISLGTGSSFTLGNGEAPVLATAVAADDICLVVADTTQVSGTLSYVKK